MMNASQIVDLLKVLVPVLIQVAEQVIKAMESGGDKAALAGRCNVTVNFTGEQPATAEQPAPQPVTATAEQPKRGPGRPKKAETAAAANAPTPAALDISSVTTLCSEKMKELGGKLNGDEAAARQMVKEAVKAAAGVERLKEVPADKLAAVRDAVSALDVPVEGGDEGELDEF